MQSKLTFKHGQDKVDDYKDETDSPGPVYRPFRIIGARGKGSIQNILGGHVGDWFFSMQSVGTRLIFY
jgi:hypothetical protein